MKLSYREDVSLFPFLPFLKITLGKPKNHSKQTENPDNKDFCHLLFLLIERNHVLSSVLLRNSTMFRCYAKDLFFKCFSIVPLIAAAIFTVPLSLIATNDVIGFRLKQDKLSHICDKNSLKSQ